jgi:hypothetical protein
MDQCIAARAVLGPQIRAWLGAAAASQKTRP